MHCRDPTYNSAQNHQSGEDRSQQWDRFAPADPPLTHRSLHPVNQFEMNPSRIFEGSEVIFRFLSKNHQESNLRFNQGANRKSHSRLSQDPCFLMGMHSHNLSMPVQSIDQKVCGKRTVLRDWLLSRLTLTHLRSEIAPDLQQAPAPKLKARLKYLELVEQRTDSMTDYLNLSTRELDRLATDEKDNSLGLQHFVTACTNRELSLLLPWLESAYTTLIDSKFGNYVVQRAVVRSQEFRTLVIRTATKNFISLCRNEFSSKCLQTLIELDSTFRKFVLRYFESHVRLIEEIAPFYLLVAAMKNSESSEEYAFLHRLICEDSSIFITLRNSKRLLIAYLESCPDTQVEDICRTINLSGNRLCRIFQEKLSTTLVGLLLDRLNLKCWESFGRIFLQQPQKLFCLKGARAVMSQLTKRGSTCANNKLASLLREAWASICLQGGLDKTYILYLAYLYLNSTSNHSDLRLILQGLHSLQLLSPLSLPTVNENVNWFSASSPEL